MSDKEIRRLLGIQKSEWNDLGEKKREKIRRIFNTPAGLLIQIASQQTRKALLDVLTR